MSLPEDYIIDALLQIGNHKKVMEMCEPQVMQPLQLQEWMVKRVLKAQELLENEWELYQNSRSGLQ